MKINKSKLQDIAEKQRIMRQSRNDLLQTQNAFYRQLAENLREARDKSGMSIQEMGKLLNITHEAVNNIESARGVRQVTIWQLYNWSIITSSNIEQLMS